MNKQTEIIFVIDASGSMADLVDDTIGGFNGFIRNQKKLEGKATLTTVLFNSHHKTLHNGVDIAEVEELKTSQYLPCGMTAMLDAVGDTIENVQNRIDNTPTSERPENVLFVIITDGHENASKHFTKNQVQKMIDHQSKGHGWDFIFLGANMDAVTEAEDIGITANHSHSYTATSAGTYAVYDSVTAAATSLRSNGVVNAEWNDALTNSVDSTRISYDIASVQGIPYATLSADEITLEGMTDINLSETKVSAL